MARCSVCGRSGLFFKVNSSGRCENCENAYQARQKAIREHEQELKNIRDAMRKFEPSLSYEECYIANHIISVINKERPGYDASVTSTSMYRKIFIPSGYSDDYAAARFKYAGTSRWLSINACGQSLKDDPLFADAQDKTKNFWKVSLQNWTDVKRYDPYFVAAADYLWKTYEIEKYRAELKTSMFWAEDANITIRFPGL